MTAEPAARTSPSSGISGSPDRSEGWSPLPAIRQLQEPDVSRTTLGSDASWQLALWETWLQERESRTR